MRIPLLSKEEAHLAFAILVAAKHLGLGKRPKRIIQDPVIRAKPKRANRLHRPTK